MISFFLSVNEIIKVDACRNPALLTHKNFLEGGTTPGVELYSYRYSEKEFGCFLRISPEERKISV